MQSGAILDSEASRKHIHNELRIQIQGGTSYDQPARSH